MTCARCCACHQPEHIVDWSESGDTARAEAEKELYDLWRDLFDTLGS
jgi:hypothetical protein